jgi:hypothetical protein
MKHGFQNAWRTYRQAGQILAEDRVSLQKLIGDLATETRRGFDRVQQHFEAMTNEADRRSREIDERMRQTDERLRQTNGRIDNLVVAIGEFIRLSKLSRSI